MEKINFQKFDIDQENRAITFSCASNIPYLRYDEQHKIEYNEILIINENSVDLSRLNNGAPLLFNHDTDKLLGMVQKAWIIEDRVYVRVRFSANDEFAERIYKDILDGIIKNVSIGYQIEDYEDKKENGIYNRYVIKWMIFETSIVSIPADNTVGIRNLKIKERKNMLKRNKKECGEEKPLEEKECDKLEEKDLAEDEEKLESEQAEQEVSESEKVDAEQAETADEKKDDEKTIEDLKAELAELKDEIAKLQEKPVDDKKPVDDQAVKEMETIAENFDVPKEELQKAIDKKLTVKEFKNIVKSFNINNIKERKNMKHEFRDYLKARDFEKPFVLRDFTGFSDSDLVGTQTLPLIAALDKRLGVKGYRAINGLHSNLSLPVQSSRIEVATKDINVDAVDSNPGFTAVTLSPKKITGSVLIGKEMLANTNSDVEAFVIDSLLKEISYTIEQKMLAAVASAATTTITYSSINAITWGDILAMEAAVDGYLLDNLAFVMNPAAKAALKQIVKASDAITGFICEDNKVNGYDVNTTGVALNDNILFGDWSQLVLASWNEGMQILVDPYSYSRAGNLLIVASALVDTAVVQPDAFAIGKVQSSSSSESSGSSN